MCKNTNIKWLIATLLLMLININATYGQSSCSNAEIVSIPDTIEVTISPTSTTHWLTFTANNDYPFIDFTVSDDLFNIQSISVYYGISTNPTLINTFTTNVFTLSNIQTNSQYYLKIIGNNIGGSFKLDAKGSWPELIVTRKPSNIIVSSSDHKACEGEKFEFLCNWTSQSYGPTHYKFMFDNGIQPEIVTADGNLTQSLPVFKQIPFNATNTFFCSCFG